MEDRATPAADVTGEINVFETVFLLGGLKAAIEASGEEPKWTKRMAQACADAADVIGQHYGRRLAAAERAAKEQA